MQILPLIDALRKSPPINFIWGAGCSALYRSSITIPSDPLVRKEVVKYDSDPLLSQIKRNFYHKTAGLEDVHSCLLALNECERKKVLRFRTNWANVCLAELLRLGLAARVLTTNFDGNLVIATAVRQMLLPLHRHTYPELDAASTPSIYLLGDAAPAVFRGLVERGAGTGPWIVAGCSGRHFGLAETLRSVVRYPHGLYWVGHFHNEPPAHLGDDFFTPERNAAWISGFDADSFMAYLLRGLAEFPPVPPARASDPECHRRTLDSAAQLELCLSAFEKPQDRSDIRAELAEVDRIRRAGPAEVQTVVAKLIYKYELAVRTGESAQGLGVLACKLAEARSPREVKPLLIKAADLMEPDAPEDVMGRFGEICCILAGFTIGDDAHRWFARADAAFAQMDFGPSCGAPLPYGHLPKWAALLTKWSCYQNREESAAIFDRARSKFEEVIGHWTELVARNAAPPDPAVRRPLFRSNAAPSSLKNTIIQFIGAFQQRARSVSRDDAVGLLREARSWLEKLHNEQGPYTEILVKQLFREAEVEPARESDLMREAESLFNLLLTLLPGQAAAILFNWASALGDLAMARSGKDAFRLYAAADAKFQEVERLDGDPRALHKNWSSILLREARERGGPPELWERARQQAERCDALEPGDGAYNLACIAAETGDQPAVAQWLTHAAAFGKIPTLSHILSDINFQRLRQDPWFRNLLDSIFQ